MSLIGEIHYFRIPVLSLEESVRWYTECLGFHLRRQNEQLAVFELKEEPLLVLLKADTNSRGHFLIDGKPEFSVGFTCPEIHKFRQQLMDQNVEVDEMNEEDGHFYFHFYDPSKNKLQIHW
ncbi:VOC family protein [Paenibacillus harenae]|uniref:VOC family protein n=1 Tax=Paenibacillus harenae TaxID=306543 RepID=UPI0027933DD4|nr:VOC family protein [Paenibacillus harenae]MDQ0060027.1 catechol 2,3-dioxygenase-like lactoylglutathione lyase family enzyme [Paenibacillus harenae]